MVLASRIEASITSRTSVSAPKILCNCQFQATVAAQDGQLMLLSLGPDMIGMSCQLFMAADTAVVLPAAFVPDGNNIKIRRPMVALKS